MAIKLGRFRTDFCIENCEITLYIDYKWCSLHFYNQNIVCFTFTRIFFNACREILVDGYD